MVRLLQYPRLPAFSHDNDSLDPRWPVTTVAVAQTVPRTISCYTASLVLPYS